MKGHVRSFCCRILWAGSFLQRLENQENLQKSSQKTPDFLWGGVWPRTVCSSLFILCIFLGFPFVQVFFMFRFHVVVSCVLSFVFSLLCFVFRSFLLFILFSCLGFIYYFSIVFIFVCFFFHFHLFSCCFSFVHLLFFDFSVFMLHLT